MSKNQEFFEEKFNLTYPEFTRSILSKHPKLTRLINEIKLEEESDKIHNSITSHCDYYIYSMQKLTVDPSQFKNFINLSLIKEFI